MKNRQDMHWNNVVAKEELEIKGKGKILLVNLKDFTGDERNKVEECMIEVGDSLRYSGDEYTVKSIGTRVGAGDKIFSEVELNIVKRYK